MDSTRQALQTNVKHFQISKSFFELTTFFENNSGVGVIIVVFYNLKLYVSEKFNRSNSRNNHCNRYNS